jgi:chorismate mutase
MPTFAIRGATVADENSEHAILTAARELVKEIIAANRLEAAQVVSALFTLTPDLNAAFPSRGAREIGWTEVALLDAQQPAVRGDLARCIRVLVHFNRVEKGDPVRHVYLKAARALRPDRLSF